MCDNGEIAVNWSALDHGRHLACYLDHEFQAQNRVWMRGGRGSFDIPWSLMMGSTHPFPKDSSYPSPTVSKKVRKRKEFFSNTVVLKPPPRDLGFNKMWSAINHLSSWCCFGVVRILRQLSGSGGWLQQARVAKEEPEFAGERSPEKLHCWDFLLSNKNWRFKGRVVFFQDDLAPGIIFWYLFLFLFFAWRQKCLTKKAVMVSCSDIVGSNPIGSTRSTGRLYGMFLPIPWNWRKPIKINGIPWDRSAKIYQKLGTRNPWDLTLGISYPFFSHTKMGAATGTELLKTKFHDSPEVYALSRTSKVHGFLAMINGTGGNQKMERDMKWGMKWIWYDVIHCLLRCPTANPFPLESFCQHDSGQFPPRQGFFWLLNSKRGDNWPCHTCHAKWTW